MILLDTHIWVWWVSSSEDLKRRHREAIEASRFDGVGISVISCWEVAKLVEYNRLELTMDVSEWMREALRLPEMQLVELTPGLPYIPRLPGDFHSDPADQIIVATARIYDVKLVTEYRRIQRYKHVQVV